MTSGHPNCEASQATDFEVLLDGSKGNFLGIEVDLSDGLPGPMELELGWLSKRMPGPIEPELGRLSNRCWVL